MEPGVAERIENARHGEDAGIRREALIELGYMTDAEIFPVFIEQMSDPNASVKHAAVVSLGRYGNPEAIEELVKPKVLHSPHVNVRWAAVAAIGKLGDFRIIDHLLKAVDDDEWIVRNQAVTELKIKIQDIIEMKDVRHVRILVRLLALDHAEIVNLAVEGFEQFGDACLDVLLDSLDSSSTPVRHHIARALGLQRASQAVPELIQLLHDPEWVVRQAAAEALGRIKSKKAIEPLVQGLRDNVEAVQKAAMKSLVVLGSESTKPLLNALTYEKNKYAVRAAILTLGQIGDESAVPTLIDQMRNSYFVIRRSAVRALSNFGPSITKQLLPKLSYNISDISQLLKEAGNRRNPPMQIRAIKALGGLEDHRAVGVLKMMVDQASDEVQDAAVQALIQIGTSAWGRCGALRVLSQIGDKKIAKKLLPCIIDDSDNVRLEAIRAIPMIAPKMAVEPLIKAGREDRDAYIRCEAIKQLRAIGVVNPKVLEFCLSAISDQSRDVRSQAVRLLGIIQDESAIQPLMEALADRHWSVRESAENALFNYGGKVVDQLIDVLYHRSWTIRFRAVRLLGEIGDPRAMPALEKMLKKQTEKDKVKDAVYTALNKLKAKAAA